MDDALEDRVDALERAVTDGDGDLSGLAEAGEITARLDAVESQLTEIERRIDELDGATQALRGYVGNIRSVNRDVEDRADAALSKVESLEEQINNPEHGGSTRSATDSCRDNSKADSGVFSGAVGASGDHLGPDSERRDRVSLDHAANVRETHERRCGECGRPKKAERGHPPADTESRTARTARETNSADSSTANGHDPFGSHSELSDADDPIQPDISTADGSSGPLERIRQLL